MSKPDYICPECGDSHFELAVTQLVDVVFAQNGDHAITDGPRGDMEWSDSTQAICKDCGWAGTLSDAKEL